MTPESGIGAALTIGIDKDATHSLRKFPAKVGRHMEPDELHVTLVQPGSDIAIPVHSQIDLNAITDTHDEWARILKGSGVTQVELDHSQLHRLGRHLCFKLTRESFGELKDLRARLARVALDNLCVGLASRDFTPHLSIARLNREVRTAEAERTRPPALPRKVDVVGFDIWQTYSEEQPTRSGGQYTNRPSGLRYS